MMSWLHVEARLPAMPLARPPILMVHGACSSSWVWREWQRALAEEGWATYALALRGHRGSPTVDLASVTMKDYVEDIATVARHLSEPPVVMGWSMGGLLALLYAVQESTECPGLIVLAPSTSAETQEPATPQSLDAIPAVFGPDYYGIRETVAASRSAMPDLTEAEGTLVVTLMGAESGTARRERKAGISIPTEALRCPLLVLAGERDRQYSAAVCRRVAEYYRGALLEVPQAGHLGLVMSGAGVAWAAPQVHAWLEHQVLGEGKGEGRRTRSPR